jgi:hypothetical protein
MSMPTAKKHIILVNYDFPPNKGIGGRRWGKLAKELAAQNCIIHVIKADAISDTDKSVWSEEVNNTNIFVHSLPRVYPQILLTQPTKFFEKLQYKKALNDVNKNYKGTPFDISLGWEKHLVPKLNEIVKKHPIEWVFATGAPWDILRVVAEWKKENSSIKYWADFRDPWLNARNYGMPFLSPDKKKEEVNKTNKVIQNADVLSAPAKQILEHFNTLSSTSSINKKFFHLKHFHSEPKLTEQSFGFSSSDIIIEYGGEIYLDTEIYFEQLALDLTKLREIDPGLYERLKINFHSSSFAKIQAIFKHHPCVRVSDSIGKKIDDRIAQAHWCIILLAEHNKDFFTTKYFEYQTLESPYLYVGASGEVLESIEKENRGTSWSNFFQSLIQSKPLSPSDFNQKASEDNSLSFRAREILNHMNTFL